MAESEIFGAGLFVVAGGALKHFLDYGLRAFKANADVKDREAERELKLSHSTLEYADSLKEHVQRLEDKIDAQQREISEMHDLVKGLYQRNDELRRQNEEYAKHLSICTLATA